MKQHLSTPLEAMTSAQRGYFEQVCEQEADRLIARYGNEPNVLRGIALKLRQAGDKAVAKELAAKRPSGPNAGMGE